MDQTDFHNLVAKQRDFFRSEQTRGLAFRTEQLCKLKSAIIKYQEEILESLRTDLGRSAFEGYFEINLLEINLALKNLKNWVKPKKVKSQVDQFPSSAWIHPDPLGVVLIISPWNYPFQLAISPLVGAIAAGNCAIVKPSEYAPRTSAIIAKLIAETFDPSYIAVVEGDVTVGQKLLTEKFDHIFFTGSTKVGRLVMQAAAQNLTPVTLELGGKCPCIVDADVHIDHAAKRIAWGKFYNAGQTCIAPDYLVVHRAIKGQFVAALLKAIQELYGDVPAQSPDYGRIVNRFHIDRLTALLTDQKILVGGQSDPSDRYLAPTVVDDVSWDSPLMAAEIFGPILPILTYENLDEVIHEINDRPKPLALYFFSGSKQKQERILRATFSGGVCLNDVLMHGGVIALPFGGVGESGIGSYHGKATFDALSHFKSVLRRGLWSDLTLRYPPYKKEKVSLIKKILLG